MKILVCIKRIPDPNQKLKIQENQLDLSATTWQMNQFDEYALEAALRLTEDAKNPSVRLGEVCVLSIGPKEIEPHLRTALAMGADRAIWVDALEQDMDASLVSSVIEKIVHQQTFDLILLGKLGSDHESNEVGQRLAARLGIPQATFASSIVVESNEKRLLVGREVDMGTEMKRVLLPAVITVDLRIISPQAIQNGITAASHAYAEGPRYASLKGIRAAQGKPFEKYSFSQLGVDVGKKVKTVTIELPPSRKAGVRVQSVQELVEKLYTEAKVLS